MGGLAEDYNDAHTRLTRAEGDAFSARSHQRAASAWKAGYSHSEFMAVSVGQRKGRPGRYRPARSRRHDRRQPRQASTRLLQERNRDGRLRLAHLRRCCGSRRDGQEHGRPPRSSVASRDFRPRAGPRTWLLPAAATGLGHPEGVREGRDRPPTELNLVEIDEALQRSASSQPAHSDSPKDIVNVNGGVIALGHPVGMSGSRVILHLALELQRRGGGVGASALCGGGGQGDTLVIRVPNA
jgi:acetyl-CoA C-acetyltransferase